MKTTLCTWEDEACNRQVQFSIDYSIENGAIRIEKVTPCKVSLICPETHSVRRTLGVHTRTGQEMLARKFEADPSYVQLATAIGSPNADVRLPHMAIRMDVAAV